MKGYKFGLILTFLIFFLNSSISHAADINWFTTVVEPEVGSKYTLGTGRNEFGIDFIAIKKSDSYDHIDINFGDNGTRTVSLQDEGLDPKTAKISLENGKIIININTNVIRAPGVGGDQYKYLYTIRLNSDGYIDSTFGDNGILKSRFDIKPAPG